MKSTTLTTTFYKQNQQVNAWEEIIYTPPKSSIDHFNFESFISSGAFSLQDSEKNVEDISFCNSPNITVSNQDHFFKSKYENVQIENSTEVDNLSVASSHKTCGQTSTTADSYSNKTSKIISNLNKRKPDANKLPNWITSQIHDHELNGFEDLSLTQENKVFFDSCFKYDLKNETIAKIALYYFDNATSNFETNWLLLSFEDQQLLTTYLSQFSDIKVSSYQTNTFGNPELVTIIKYNSPRNEEKLNRTVKKVHSLIAKSFSRLNQLSDTSVDEMDSILQQAYFESGIEKVFGQKGVFSQKKWGQVLNNTKYAQDFEDVLKTTFIEVMLARRLTKTTKEIKKLRKSMLQCSDLEEHSLCLKRSPWLLEDLIDGARLCQSIIDNNKRNL